MRLLILSPVTSNVSNNNENVSISRNGESMTLSSNFKKPPSIWNKAKQYCSQSTLQRFYLHLSFTIPSNNSSS